MEGLIGKIKVLCRALRDRIGEKIPSQNAREELFRHLGTIRGELDAMQVEIKNATPPETWDDVAVVEKTWPGIEAFYCINCAEKRGLDLPCSSVVKLHEDYIRCAVCQKSLSRRFRGHV